MISHDDAHRVIADAAAVQARIDTTHYGRHLGLRVEQTLPDRLYLRLPFNQNFVATPELGGIHGGMIASLVDAACGYVLMSLTGWAHATIDLRVDFHRRPRSGDLLAIGRPLKIGRRLCSADADIHDSENRHVASGRAVFTPTDIRVVPEPLDLSDRPGGAR